MVGAAFNARSGWRHIPTRPRPSISTSDGNRSAATAGADSQLAAGRGVVEQHAQHLGAGDSVNGRVMHLRQHRHRAVLQTLDDVELPQRARPI